MRPEHKTRWGALLGVLALAGCATVGPETVSRDRFDFNGAVARSWKEQTLLNIVKTRYMDVPVFLEVSQIVGGYTLEGTVSFGALGYLNLPDDQLSVGTQGKWIDRPTITYTPLTGAQFNRNMLTPIAPQNVLFAMQAGWNIDLVFRLAVKTVNGISDSGPTAERYQRMLTLLRALQLGQAIGMRVKEIKPNQSVVVFFFRTREIGADMQAMSREVRKILGLPEGREELTVVFGAVPLRDTEIAMLTRSMLQVFVDLGAHVEVPEADLREGRAAPGSPAGQSGMGKLRIRHSPERPADALVAVPYRGGWFWIDDRDLESKRAFALAMLLSTLTESGTRESLPLVTIPAG